MTVMTAAFPRQARVRTRAQYDRVFGNARRCAASLMTLHWHQDGAPPRLGLAVSRKVDRRAVGRNHVKRALREQFRQLRGQLRPGAYVIVARTGASAATGPALQHALVSLLQRAGALPGPSPGVTMAGRAPNAPPAPHPSTPATSGD